MVSRRNFLLAGGAGLGASAGLLAIGGNLAGAATAPAAAASVATQPLAPAPQGFIALADALTGQIGIDRVLVNRSFATLNGVVPDLETTAAQLAEALPQVATLTDPQARLAALEAKGSALKELFLRLNTALYLGTAEDAHGTRNCFGFETTASNQVMADIVQPPSYCTGSPNFWVDAPANAAQETARA